MERKNFLRAFAVAAAAGPMVLDACKKDATTKTSSSTSTTTSGTTTTTTGTCVTTPTKEEGPYPYASGEINNPLNRSDVTESQPGVALSLNFVIVNTNDSCNTVENVRVDIWSCNADGYYSGYANQPGILGTQSYVGKTFLRGYQLSDSAGVIKFSTIYPGWYTGRATHIHIEVFVGSVLKKISQLAFPEDISNAVQVTGEYAAHGGNPMTNANDQVFGGSSTDLAIEMLSLTGSISEGYSTTHTIGLAL